MMLSSSRAGLEASDVSKGVEHSCGLLGSPAAGKLSIFVSEASTLSGSSGGEKEAEAA